MIDPKILKQMRSWMYGWCIGYSACIFGARFAALVLLQYVLDFQLPFYQELLGCYAAHLIDGTWAKGCASGAVKVQVKMRKLIEGQTIASVPYADLPPEERRKLN